MFYEMLTSRRPFEWSGTAAQYLYHLIYTDPKFPRECDGGIPEALERICLKCLAKDPFQRYNSAAEIARELRHYCSQVPAK
jgi:eukaryotic-like serine/threonine-protein kinase